MKELKEKELDNIYGGDSISGTVINAIANIINMVRTAGYDLGSGIRRLAENEACPLK